MKFGKTIIVLLLLNLAAVGYFIVLRHQSPDGTEAFVPTVAKVVQPSPRNRTASVTVVTNDFRWQQLESEDYRTYIQRLRSIGCPEETLRDIIIADLDKLMAPRLRSIYPRHKDLKYWESEEEELMNNYDRRKWLQQEQTIDQEKRAVIQELLGVDLVNRRLKLKGQEDYYQRRLGFLPEEKRLEIRNLIEKFNAQEMEIRSVQWEEGVSLSAEDRAELKRLRQERETELNQLLSPQERAQYDLWMSDAASQVRHDLYGMDATEQEFLAVYQLRKDFDAQWSRDDFDPSDPRARQQWDQVNQQLDRQIRAQLGEQRFAEYKRGQDPDYHLLNAAVSRYNLPQETANEVYEYKRAFMEMRDQVGTDPSLTPDQKDVAMRAIVEETERAVQVALGERAYRYYGRRADWLRP